MHNGKSDVGMLNERIVQWIVYLNKLEQETVYQLAFESRKKNKANIVR